MADRSYSWRKELKRGASGLAARLWSRPRITPDELRRSAPRRILIVRQHNQMGDMVCATPAFRAVREAFPDAEIGLVCAPVNRDVVRHSPHLDRVFLYDKRACTRPGPLWAFLRELRTFGPDLAFVLNSVSFSVTSAVLGLGSGARTVVGGDSEPFGFAISRHAYSLEMPSFPEMDRHAVEHNLAPLAAVGLTTEDLSTVVVPSPGERARAAEIAAAAGADAGSLWMMHPGAGKDENLWPTERFAEIAARIVDRGAPLLVLQGPADGRVVAVFERALERLRPDAGGGWSLNPPVTVGVCAALLERADRFLCNDTGLMHVAGAVRTPTTAVFGPTDPALWAPRNPELTALRAADGLLKSVTVDEAWTRLLSLDGR